MDLVLQDALKNTQMVNDLKKDIRKKLAYECQKRLLKQRNESKLRYDINHNRMSLRNCDFYAIISNYLEKNNLEYTRSMLALETGQQQYNDTDIVANLTGQNNSHPLTLLLTARAKENPDSPILDSILFTFKEFLGKGNKEVSVQVDEESTELDVILGTIDRANTLSKNRIVSELKQKFDSELAELKSKLQQLYQSDLTSQIEAIRKGEIQKLKVEFEAQLEEELSKRERLLIERYDTKIKSFQIEKRNFDEHRAQLLKSDNSDIFLRRQLLEAQVHELASKHNQMEKEEARVSSLQYEMEARIREKTNKIDQMRSELDQDRKNFELKVMGRVEEMRLADQSAISKEKARLANAIEALEQERESVALKFRTAQKRLEEASELKAKFEEMADIDYKSLKSENGLLQSENKNLKSRLTSLLIELEQERQQKAQIESQLVVKTKAASQVDQLRHELEQEKLAKIKEIADLISSSTELKMTITNLRKQLSTCEKMNREKAQSRGVIRTASRGISQTIEETKQRIAELDQQSSQLDREFQKWSMRKSLPIDLDIDLDNPDFLDVQNEPYSEYLREEENQVEVDTDKKAELDERLPEKQVILDTTLNFSLEDTLPEKEASQKPQKVSFASFISKKDEEDSHSNSNDFFD